MGSSVLKVSLWLTRSCPLLFKHSQGSGVWLHSCWFWWRLKCFQSCCCWEHLSSLSKCQSGTRCFPWDHSLSWTKAVGTALWGTAENPCAALATGNGCCCLLQFLPNPWDNSRWFLPAAAGARRVRAAPALQELSSAGFPCSSSLCPQGSVALSVLGHSSDSCQRCCWAGAPVGQALSRSLPAQGKAPADLGVEKGPLQAQGFCHSLGKITHSNSLIFLLFFFVICLSPPQ